LGKDPGCVGGDVAVVGAGGGAAGAPGMDGRRAAVVAAPRRGLVERRVERAVVGAVAEDENAAQVLVAAVPLPDLVQPQAHVGALAGCLALEVRRLQILSALVENQFDALFVAEAVERG